MRMQSVPRIVTTVLCAALLTPAPLTAQSDAPSNQAANREQKELARQELERKSFALVDEVVAEVWGLKLPENRLSVLTAAADLLWQRDEKRARGLFWDALNNLNLIINPADTQTGTKSQSTPKPKKMNQYYEAFGLRKAFLHSVGRRDPQLALDMLRMTRMTAPEQSRNKLRWAPDETELEQQIAAAATASDPKRALQIARESLAKGLNFQLLDLLFKLTQRDSEAATQFAGDIIEKLHAQNLARDMRSPGIAVNLLELSRAPRERLDRPAAASRVKILKLSEEQKREIVEMLVNASLSVSAGPDLLLAVAEVKPEIESFAPGRLAELENKLARFSQTLNKEQRDWNNHNSLVSSGDAEGMIRAAADAEGDLRDSLYREAILIAVMRNRADSLRQLINTEVAESRRKSLLDALDAEQINGAAYLGKTEELEKLLPQIRLKEARARAMAELAVLFEKKGNHEEAVKLMAEAETMVKTDLRSETQTEALLTLVFAYALIEPAKAFAIVERIADKANDEISRLVLVDKVVRSGAIKNGEIRLEQSGLQLDFAFFKYGKGVAALATADFNRTKAVAERFQRNELRLLTQLIIAKALLKGDESVAPY